MFDTPLNTNDQSIERVLGAGLPVVLVFLDGAAPTALAQTMERVAREHAGELLLAKVQVRDNPESQRRFGVERTPALATVRQGQPLSTGQSITASDLEKHAAYLLGKGPKPEASPAAQTQQAGQSKQAGGDQTRPASANGYANGRGAPTSSGTPVTVTDSSFQAEVMRSSLPVLVDFWAPWCAPCRMTDPILHKLAKEMNGRIKIAKVNVDENPQVANQYGIRSIPTMLVVKDGKIAAQWVGALPEPALRSKIAPFLV